METDTSTFSAIQSAVFNADHRDLFHFVAHPDTVEMWFQWISHFRSADSKTLGVGKLYQAIYSFPLLGDSVMLFRVVEYVPDTRIVLESESLLRPRVEITSAPVHGQQTKLTFKFTFRRSSTLFQYTLAPVLHVLAQQHMKNSLAILSQI
ncbi:hypothetical protein L9F63_000467 [Diploptera punctata]|uniref:Uncharacterized protein n=1 Tax=Diploptera punctata TaxID=6984 RepID=A0AAD8ET63_DIPPU|nr:hypothetical protein L9F63_000467 [Diploptera punctata]